MGQPSFFEGAAKLFTSIPLMSWKLWAVWTVLRSRAPFMYDELVQESFNFYGKTLSVLSRFVNVGSAAWAPSEGSG